MGQPFDPSDQNSAARQPGLPVQPGYPAPPPAHPSHPGHAADFTQPNAPVPLDRPSPYAPSAAPPPARRRPWGAAFIGLAAGLVIAVAAGAVLVATNVIHFGSEPAAAVSAEPMTLPAELAGFQDLLAVNKALLTNSSMSAERKAALLAAQQANQVQVTKATVATYQHANPGAAAAFRTYADAELVHSAGVVAVRAAYPGLTVGPVSDPAFLGLAVAREQVKNFGDVDCLITQQTLTQAGSPVDPAKDLTTVCQRTGPALTVQVFGSSFQGATDQQSMIALTDAAWTAVGG